MAGDRPMARLRQAVLVARELEPLCGQLEAALGLAAPFHDPRVKEFGLANAVFAVGDCFLEVIAPVEPDTAAGRHLDRFGPGGYMVLFDLEDLEGARDRAQGLGVRVVWRIDLPDISGTHLHPSDMRGAIVSLDRSEPYGTWRWGGPDWTGREGVGAPGRLVGITVAVEEPQATAARWATVLGVEVAGEGEATVALDGGRVSFERPGEGGREGLSTIEIDYPGAAPCDGEVELGGARFVLREPRAAPLGD
jgi:Glyoxalase-like domain